MGEEEGQPQRELDARRGAAVSPGSAPAAGRARLDGEPAQEVGGGVRLQVHHRAGGIEVGRIEGPGVTAQYPGFVHPTLPDCVELVDFTIQGQVAHQFGAGFGAGLLYDVSSFRSGRLHFFEKRLLMVRYRMKNRSGWLFSSRHCRYTRLYLMPRMIEKGDQGAGCRGPMIPNAPQRWLARGRV